jgi:hypothetical protein
MDENIYYPRTRVERSYEIYQTRDILEKMLTRLGIITYRTPGEIPNLDLLQELFLSHDFDRPIPYLRHITMSHFFDARCHHRFGSLSEAVKIARSLLDTEVNLGNILSCDDTLIDQIDAIPLTPEAAVIIRRMFNALDRGRPIAVWDLALAATVNDIEPHILRPVLDFLEQCGGDTGRCREFLAFCERV